MRVIKNMLVVVNTMGRAGAESALITMLRAIDYSRVSVSLFSVIDRGEMFLKIPEQVTVLNKNPSKKSVLGTAGAMYIIKKIFTRMFRRGYILRYIPYAFKNAAMQLRAGRFQFDKLLWLMLAQTADTPETQYDLAIAFMEGAATYYVADKITAGKKMAFIHVNFEKAGYMKELDGKYYEKMDYICCVSEPLKRAIDESVFPEMSHKTRIFPNIVNREEILSAADLEGGFSDGFKGIRIVTVARLHPQKGLDVAIGAMARLSEAGYENVRWYVIGDGVEKAKLERLIKSHSLNDKFILLGAKDNPYIYVKQADIYVQPSRFEGLSLSLMEAIILNRPCVTTDFDGLPDLLHNGEDAVIIKLSEDNIVKALIPLIDNSELRDSISEATKHVKLEFPNEVKQLYKIMDGMYWEG